MPDEEAFRALEERLAAAESRFNSIIDVIDAGVLVLDSSGVVVHCNEAATYLLGTEHDGLTGEPFGRPLSHGDKIYLNTVASDGSVRYVEMKHFRTTWHGEAADLITLQDCTEHRETLGLAREEIRRRDDFLSMLSHELRNPLSAVSNAATILSMAADEGPETKAASSVLHRQFDHLRRMLNELLDVARVSRGKLMVQTATVDAVDLIREAIGVAEGVCPLSERELVLDLPERSIEVEVDAMRLQQVLVNLIVNAVRYSDHGAEIRLKTVCDDQNWCIEVSDAGQGIDPDMLDKIFEPFVQSSEAIDRQRGGLGVGLSLARNIVLLHHGTITAESSGLGHGTKMKVRIPLRKEPLSVAIPPSTNKPATDVLTILLVDAATDVRVAMASLIRSLGYHVQEADNGENGWTHLKHDRPAIAFVDLELPDIEGFAVAKRAAKLQSRGDFSLIAMTASDADQHRVRAIRSGFDDILVKPIDQERLRSVLRNHTARSA